MKSHPLQGSSALYIEEIQKKQKNQYMMLGRYQQDMKYYFGFGNCNPEHCLYYKNYKKHVDEMLRVWNELKIKPEWLLISELNKYRNHSHYYL